MADITDLALYLIYTGEKGLIKSTFSNDKLGKVSGKKPKELFNSFETNGFPKAVSYKDKNMALVKKNIKRVPVCSVQ